MDFSKIKNLVRQNGDKFIFLENGEPEIVVMSFQEYTKLSHGDAPHAAVPELYPAEERMPRRPLDTLYGEVTPEVASEITETEFIAPPEFAVSNLPIRLEDIRLEDLPI